MPVWRGPCRRRRRIMREHMINYMAALRPMSTPPARATGLKCKRGGKPRRAKAELGVCLLKYWAAIGAKARRRPAGHSGGAQAAHAASAAVRSGRAGSLGAPKRARPSGEAPLAQASTGWNSSTARCRGGRLAGRWSAAAAGGRCSSYRAAIRGACTPGRGASTRNSGRGGDAASHTRSGGHL